MPRSPRPWWNAQKSAWYCWMDGKRVRLGVKKREAETRLAQLLTARERGEVDGSALTVRDVFNIFLEDLHRRMSRGERSQKTQDWYLQWLPAAAQSFGHLKAHALRPHHVEAWLDGHPAWGPTTRANVVGSIKAAFRWAVKVGHLERDPVARLERPRARRREVIPTEQELRAIREHWSDEPWRDLITALVESGCRPGEVYGVTAADTDSEAGTWMVLNKTRDKTGRDRRTVHLTPTLVDLTKKLIARHPTGPLFRSNSGEPWNNQTVAARFRRLRLAGKIRPGIVAYTLRHLYVTDAIERGVDVATLGALVGHTSPQTTLSRYNKISQRAAHLREAAAKVRPG